MKLKLKKRDVHYGEKSWLKVSIDISSKYEKIKKFEADVFVILFFIYSQSKINTL